jgi:hypothetical protein
MFYVLAGTGDAPEKRALSFAKLRNHILVVKCITWQYHMLDNSEQKLPLRSYLFLL